MSTKNTAADSTATKTASKGRPPKDPNAPKVVPHRVDYTVVDRVITENMRAGRTAPMQIFRAVQEVDPKLNTGFIRTRVKALHKAGVRGVTPLDRIRPSAPNVEALNAGVETTQHEAPATVDVTQALPATA